MDDVNIQSVNRDQHLRLRMQDEVECMKVLNQDAQPSDNDTMRYSTGFSIIKRVDSSAKNTKAS